jgi:hypothetical protein
MPSSTSAKLEMTKDRESFGALFSELAIQSSALVRDELELARKEVAEGILQLRRAAIVAAAGIWLMTLAITILAGAAIVTLAQTVGLLYSFLIVGGAVLLVSLIVSAIGLKKLRATQLTPRQTIQTLEEDKVWLKDMA